MNIFEKLVKKYENYRSILYILFLRIMGANIGKEVKIYGKIYIIGYYQNLTIGDNTTLNHGVVLNLSDKVNIGCNVRVSTYVTFHTGKLISNIAGEQSHITSSIVIENNVWIASSCVINPGVSIGNDSIVGANSFININIEPYTMYAGSPAKLIKRIEHNEF